MCLLITVAIWRRFLSINMMLRFEEFDLDSFKISRVGIFGCIRAYQKSYVRFRGVCVRCYYNCLISMRASRSLYICVFIAYVRARVFFYSGCFCVCWVSYHCDGHSSPSARKRNDFLASSLSKLSLSTLSLRTFATLLSSSQPILGLLTSLTRPVVCLAHLSS